MLYAEFILFGSLHACRDIIYMVINEIFVFFIPWPPSPSLSVLSMLIHPYAAFTKSHAPLLT